LSELDLAVGNGVVGRVGVVDENPSVFVDSCPVVVAVVVDAVVDDVVDAVVAVVDAVEESVEYSSVVVP
jgi:hypothetical protein